MDIARLPPDITDGEIQRMLRAESHEHVEKILDSMSDEAFAAFVSRLIEWSKRRTRLSSFTKVVLALHVRRTSTRFVLNTCKEDFRYPFYGSNLGPC